MSRVQFVALFLRLFGVYLVIQDLDVSILAFGTVSAGDLDIPQQVYGAFIGAILIKYGVAFVLVFFPSRLVVVCVPGYLEDESTTRGLDIEILAQILFAALGIYFIVPALTSLIVPVRSLLLSGELIQLYADWYSFSSLVVAPVVHLLVGLWLVFGAKGLMPLLKRLRKIQP